MKKLLSILLLSVVLIGCSEERVNKVDTEYNYKENTTYYSGKPFTGITFLTFSNGQLQEEIEYKNGKRNGFSKRWDKTGQLTMEANFKDGERDGLWKFWNQNGQRTK